MEKRLSTFLLICGILFGFPENGKSAILSINPRGKNGATFSCRPTRDDVDFLQILKEERDKTTMIAYITINSTTKISKGFKDNFKAKGHIDKLNSYLTLTLDDPKPQDVAMYSCEAFYKTNTSKCMQSTSKAWFNYYDTGKLDHLQYQITSLNESLRTQHELEEKVKEQQVKLEHCLSASNNDKFISLERKIANLTSQMTLQYDERLTKQEKKLESLQNKVNDSDSKKTSVEQLAHQNEIFELLQTNITNMNSKLTAHEEKLEAAQKSTNYLASKVTSQEKSLDERLHYQNETFTDLQAKITNLTLEFTSSDKKLKIIAKLKKKQSDMENDLKYRFETIRRKNYVSDGRLRDVMKTFKEELNTQSQILTRKHDVLDERVDLLNASLHQLSTVIFENITKEYAKKDDLLDVQTRMDEVDTLLKADSEQISLLKDKVSVNEYLITTLSSKPASASTKAPGKDPVVDVAKRVTALEQDHQNQTQLMKYVLEKAVEQETNVSAFSACVKKVTVTAKNQVILFDDVRVNKGNAYDPTTGVFTAPRSGIYGFNLVILSRKSDEWLDLDLQSNKDVLMTLSSHETDHEEQTSVSTVAKLNAGDEVKVIVKYTSTNSKAKKTKIADQSFSGFSGYFIQAV